MVFWSLLFFKAGAVRYSLTTKWVPGNPDGYPLEVIGVFLTGSPGAGLHDWSTGFPTDENCGNDFPTYGCMCRPFPGPVLRANKSDTLEITVVNHFLSEETSMHFHGLHMLNNAWMDGVHGITECGISPGRNFTYKFALTQAGTYWYHSHTGVQYGDGLLGAIIIDDPDDPVKRKYNYTNEYPMLLQDWFHEASNTLMIHYNGPHGAYPDYNPAYPWPTTSVLINGRGQYNCSVLEDCINAKNLTTNETKQCVRLRLPFLGACQELTPDSQYRCTPGEWIRFRVINGASAMALRFWVEGHTFIIVSRDGVDVEEVAVGNITLPVGQRIDVMMQCNQDPTTKYRIYASTALSYVPYSEVLPKLSSYAFLVYETPFGNSTQEPPALDIWAQDWKEDMLREYTWKPTNPTYQTAPKAVKRIVLRYEVGYNKSLWGPGYPLEYWQINNKSFAMPNAPILESVYFKKTADINQPGPFSTYTEPLALGETYEIVMIADDIQQHPWHMHGHSVCFLGAEYFQPELEWMERNGNTSYVPLDWQYDEKFGKLGAAVNCSSYGDSFVVPGKAYAVFRVTANNPGPWLFHCHMEWHLAMGMGLLFDVQASGTYGSIMSPPNNFPLCDVPVSALSPAALTTPLHVVAVVLVFLFILIV